MKFISIILLLFPFVSVCQTVHVEKGRIAYKGEEKIEHLSREEMYKIVKRALSNNIHGHEHQFVVDDEKNGELSMNGEMRLRSSFNLVRVLEYSIRITIKKGEYKYKIDSVFIRENERHVKTKDISSEELLKGMEISGNIAINTERQLNEIDMYFQKLLDQLHNDIADAKKNQRASER